MSQTTVSPILRHNPPYQSHSWDRVGIATIAPHVDLIELRKFYDKVGRLPDDTHPSLVYHANSMNIENPVNLVSMSLKKDRSLELGTGHLYVRTILGMAEPTASDIAEAIEILRQIEQHGTLEYVATMPTGSGSEVKQIVDVKLNIEKLLAIQAQCLQIDNDLQSILS